MRRTAPLLLLLLIMATPALADGEADRQFTFAARLMTDGQVDLADEAFADFLRDHADDKRVSDVWYYRALLAMRRDDSKSALACLNKATRPLTVKPSRITLLRGQLSLAAGQAAEAAKLLEQVKADELADDAARASWHYLLGAAYRNSKKPEAAATQFAKATEAKSPVYARAQLELGKTLIVLNRHTEAFEALNELSRGKVNADVAAEATALAAALAYRLKQFEQSASLYERLVDRYAASAHAERAQVGVMRALFAAGKYERVIEQHTQQADRLPPASVTEGLYLRAASLVQLRRYDEATAVLRQFTQRAKVDDPLRRDAIELAGVCLYHQDTAAFDRWYAANKPTSRLLRFLRALSADKRGDPRKAIEYLSPLITDADATYTPEALLARATLYEKVGQPREAGNDLAAFAAQFPKDRRAADAAARAIDLMLNAGDAKRANEMAAAWLKRFAAHDETGWVRLKQALAQMQLKQTGAAMGSIDAVLAAKPAKPLEAVARFYRGVLLAAGAQADKPDTAKPALAELARAEQLGLPANQQVQAIALKARLHRLTGNTAQALAAYESLRARQPNARYDPSTALWIGTGLLQRDQPKQAIAWLLLVAGADGADAATIAAARFYLAEAYRTDQQWNNAVDAYRKQLATTEGYGERGRLGLAQSLAARGKADEALEEYDGLIRADSSRVAAAALYDSAMLHLAKAQQLAAAQLADKAAPHLTEARRRLNRLVLLHDVPQLAPLPDRARLVLARVEAMTGQRQRAVERLTTMANTATGDWARLATAELRLLEGRKADARNTWHTLAKAKDPVVAATATERLASIGGAP